MAGSAVGRELGSGMVGIGSSIIIILVAADAGSRSTGTTTGVTLVAGQ